LRLDTGAGEYGCPWVESSELGPGPLEHHVVDEARPAERRSHQDHRGLFGARERAKALEGAEFEVFGLDGGVLQRPARGREERRSLAIACFEAAPSREEPSAQRHGTLPLAG